MTVLIRGTDNVHVGETYGKVYNNINVKLPDGSVKHMQGYEIKGHCYGCLVDRVSFEEDQGFFTGKVKVIKIGKQRILIKPYSKEKLTMMMIKRTNTV
ncbi:hypothetical protein CDAR_81531 [Caerostris darwini]|uniref:Uncharacterized protein n=1 Tax=Caerostris darwini TaxID=1538125 RepID=A0AAV4Q0I3_9ARAC|nr:hypothetical protein CDAR_81531 [Caerostris darwini]